MSKCDQCGDTVSMGYSCSHCNKNLCSEHRLPENHTCIAEIDSSGVDLGASTDDQNSQSLRETLRVDAVSDKFDNQIEKLIGGKYGANKLLGATIVLTYIFQLATIAVFGYDAHDTVFALQTDNILDIWTWVSSVFAHSPSTLFHLLGNMIVLVFFGTMLERIIGSRRYLTFFVISGVVAGLSQVVISMALGSSVSVLGASGALLAILGTLTVYRPHMEVYLYFLFPIPLYVITAFYGVVSIAGIAMAFGGIAHAAHLVGLVIGLLYGYKTKDTYDVGDASMIGRSDMLGRR